MITFTIDKTLNCQSLGVLTTYLGSTPYKTSLLIVGIFIWSYRISLHIGGDDKKMKVLYCSGSTCTYTRLAVPSIDKAYVVGWRQYLIKIHGVDRIIYLCPLHNGKEIQ